jgi:hypothetical protein
MFQGVLLDEAVAVRFQGTGHLARATGARAIHQTLRALVGKAVDLLAQGRIRQRERLRDRLEALPFDDLTYRLGTAEDPSLFGLFHEVVSGGEGSIGTMEFEGAHGGGTPP